jgi:hypothetical protein
LNRATPIQSTTTGALMVVSGPDGRREHGVIRVHRGEAATSAVSDGHGMLKCDARMG